MELFCYKIKENADLLLRRAIYSLKDAMRTQLLKG